MELSEKLQQLKREITESEPASVLVGMDVLSGLTKITISMIVKNCLDINGVDDIQFQMRVPVLLSTLFQSIKNIIF